MAGMPDIVTTQTIMKHRPCEYPFRIVIRLYGCNLISGKTLAEMLFTYQFQELTYYTYDADEKRVTYCPICHIQLPKTTTKEAV